MANIFQRLAKLFSGGTIVRVGDEGLKVVDPSHLQGYVTNVQRDKYSRVYSTTSMASMAGAGGNQYGMNQSYDTMRRMLYTDYDLMDNDPIIASALDIYADESTVHNEYGDILTIHCDDDELKQVLHNLFYDIINIEFNLWPWIRNMCKYGDNILFLEIVDEHGIINVKPLSIYETKRIELSDPARPNYIYYEIEGSTTTGGKKEKLESYEVAHFRLLSDTNFQPYGKSIIESGRRTWKQLTLMEDAMLIHRIMRAPEKRIIKFDIGNIPPNEVEAYMERLITKMKKVPFVDPQTGDYNLRYNMQNILEDFLLPVRGSDSGTEISNLGGLEFDSIDDIEYLRNRMMAALKIPKAFLGYEEAVSGKLTLSAEDVRFARTIERVQRIVTAELTKIAFIHLYVQGYDLDEIMDFDLKLTLPSIIYEQEKINLWKEKVQLATDIQNTNLLSSDWIYQNVFKLSESEVDEERDLVVEDVKRKFRFTQMEQGASDPAKYGYPQDKSPEENPQGQPGAEGGDMMGAMPESNNPVGRPKTGMSYGQDSHPRGRDPIGTKGLDKTFANSSDLRGSQRKNPLSLESMKALTKFRKDAKNPSTLTESSEEDNGTYLDSSNIDEEV